MLAIGLVILPSLCGWVTPPCSMEYGGFIGGASKHAQSGSIVDPWPLIVGRLCSQDIGPWLKISCIWVKIWNGWIFYMWKYGYFQNFEYVCESLLPGCLSSCWGNWKCWKTFFKGILSPDENFWYVLETVLVTNKIKKIILKNFVLTLNLGFYSNFSCPPEPKNEHEEQIWEPKNEH